MDRLFLDANVLFSIAYDPTARIASILTLANAECFTSRYAAAEALRNIDVKRSSGVNFLRHLLKQIKLTREELEESLPAGIGLPDSDRQILQAAIACEATHLLTGDKHFRPLFGRVIDGVLILRPADYLRLRQG